MGGLYALQYAHLLISNFNQNYPAKYCFVLISNLAIDWDLNDNVRLKVR